MPATALSHYNLRSDRRQMEVLKDFYCQFVGLRVGPRPAFDSVGYWLYAGSEAVLHLSEIKDGEQRHHALRTSFDHVAFQCIDHDAMLQQLQVAAIPYRLAGVPASETLPAQRQIFFFDPLGNGIELNFS